MASTQKVSISLDEKELRWVKTLSRKTRASVSSVINDAVRRLREERERRQAQEELLEQFSREDRASPDELEAFRAEWRRG
jgi:Arc/MetJ-type ribon-helix-helix transcriptional regulator